MSRNEPGTRKEGLARIGVGEHPRKVGPSLVVGSPLELGSMPKMLPAGAVPVAP